MEKIEKILAKIATLPIYVYAKCVSPFVTPSCRHTPTCSAYALEAFKKRGLFWGLFLTIKRLLNCRPGGSQGYDPVPTRGKKEHEQ